MTALVLAAAGLAIGVTVVIAGWRPEREPLAVLLARLGQDRRAASAISRSAHDRDAQVGAVALRIGAIDRSVTRHGADLRILRRSAEEQAARVVVFAVMGFLFFPAFVYMMLTIVGVDVRIIVPMWAAIGGGAVGLVTPMLELRSEAARARTEFRHALAAYCDVASIGLASGMGIESALHEAARAGEGWAFAELRLALDTGYRSGRTAWESLGVLGTELGVSDLTELAGALALAGDHGAAVLDTVSTKARSLRERLVAEAERRAVAVTERMGIPATLVLIGFTAFLLFPALAAFSSSP